MGRVCPRQLLPESLDSLEYRISGGWTENSVENTYTDTETLHTMSGSFSLSSTDSGPVSTSSESET
jgi:hypothetical protein